MRLPVAGFANLLCSLFIDEKASSDHTLAFLSLTIQQEKLRARFCIVGERYLCCQLTFSEHRETGRLTLWNCWSIPKSQIFQWRSMLNNFIDVEKSYSVRFDSEYLLLYTHQPPVKAQMPAVQCRIALG